MAMRKVANLVSRKRFAGSIPAPGAFILLEIFLNAGC